MGWASLFKLSSRVKGTHTTFTMPKNIVAPDVGTASLLELSSLIKEATKCTAQHRDRGVRQGWPADSPQCRAGGRWDYTYHRRRVSRTTFIKESWKYTLHEVKDIFLEKHSQLFEGAFKEHQGGT